MLPWPAAARWARPTAAGGGGSNAGGNGGGGSLHHHSHASQQQAESWAPRLAVFFHCCMFAGQIWSTLLLAWLLVRTEFSAYVLAALVGYFMYALGPGWRAAESNQWPTPLKRWGLWRHMADYFSATLVKTTDLDPSKHYLFCYHPHGILAVGAWLSFATEATGFSKAFPGLNVHCCTLDGNFRLPLIREYCLLHGLRSASRRALTYMLTRTAPGTSCLLVPGGAAESLLAAPGTCDLVLAKRKGFVRLAVMTGASLVPVVCFGENELYDTFIPQPGTKAHATMQLLKRVLGFATPVCWGTGLMAGWGMMPRPVPLTTVVGAPVHVARWEGPPDDRSQELRDRVDEVHAEYVAALRALWDANRERLAAGGRKVKLRLVDA